MDYLQVETTNLGITITYRMQCQLFLVEVVHTLVAGYGGILLDARLSVYPIAGRIYVFLTHWTSIFLSTGV